MWIYVKDTDFYFLLFRSNDVLKLFYEDQDLISKLDNN